jgi:hypothetical protein
MSFFNPFKHGNPMHPPGIPGMGGGQGQMRPVRYSDEGHYGYHQQGMNASTGGPGQMQGYDGSGINPMHAYTGGGLPAMAMGMPSAQTGGPGQMMQMPPQVSTGGYDAPQGLQAHMGGGLPPQQFQAYTGGGFQPQQMGGGLARMFRGFNPGGRPQMQ